MKQQEEFFELDFVKMRRWFPVLHLLRVPGMALDWRKLILAALATLLVIKSVRAIEQNNVIIEGAPSELSRPQAEMLDILGNIHSQFSYLSLTQHGSLDVTRPMWDLYLNFPTVSHSQYSDWNFFLLESFGFLSVYLIWSLAGIATSRSASYEFVSGTRGSFLKLLLFGLRGLKAALFFFFLISALISFFFFINAAWGYLVSMVLGAKFGLVTGFVPTLVSLLMFVILLGFFLGWPIMIGSISVDGSDGFDALSRSYNYVLSQFVSFLFYIFVLMILGTIFTSFIYIASGGIISILGLTTSAWVEQTGTLNASLFGWNEIIRALALGYGVSFFWSGMTVIYFLLRKAEDGTPLDEMYIHQKKEEPEGVPLVGIAERNQIEKENDV